MELALYHPEHGFYSSGRATIGRSGDYFTNVSVGPLFGRLLVAQFVQIWEQLGKSQNFVIVEQGAHHGDLARDVLGSIRKSHPEFFDVLRYEIVDPLAPLRDRQSQVLKDFENRVRWRQSLDDLEPFAGIHFSNELVDSMPVHMIVSTGDGWREEFVALMDGKFGFIEREIADPALLAFVERLPKRPAGYQTEVNLAALDWIETLSKKMTRGYVLIIDYGFSRDQLYAADRVSGTLQVRRHHRISSSPFDGIGCADITTHIDWTSLAEHAERYGLRVHSFTDQHHFLTGILSHLPDLPADPKTKRALQTLLHPEMLGRAFQVLALEKDVYAETLSGFKYARDPRIALGL